MPSDASIGLPLHLQAGEPVSVREAYQYCARLATTHYENFTIASWLMPRAMRPHMHAIYAYARIADDFADEERDLAKLDQWEAELDLAYGGRPRHPVFVALADTVARFDIPREPFADLLKAFRADIDFRGFETMDDLLSGYCRYSANPVGRIVLYLFGFHDQARQALSDKICSGLQLANFWQDVGVDLEKGRIYLPRADIARCGCTEAQIRNRIIDGNFVRLMKHEVEFARRMLTDGAHLHKLVGARLKRDVLMFAGGGLAILRAIENVSCDVFNRRPALHKFDYVKLGVGALFGRLPRGRTHQAT